MTITREQIRAAVVRALGAVAPETDAGGLDERAPLREALDIDSMDFLNFVRGLHASLGVDVPEADYPKIQTLGACVEYLGRRLGA
jgi:acyl carrier protein